VSLPSWPRVPLPPEGGRVAATGNLVSLKRIGWGARVVFALGIAASLAVSLGFPAPQVAEWAGHSVYVLMKACA